MAVTAPPLTDFDHGFLIGLLATQGSFGGDGRQPQIVLRMHVRHERIFRWLESRFPECRLYGPYDHSGRHYYQWMARGRPLVDEILPWLDPEAVSALDAHAGDRLREMCERYAGFIGDQRRRAATGAGDASAADDPPAPGGLPGP